jgi:hypothetical protein
MKGFDNDAELPNLTLHTHTFSLFHSHTLFLSLSHTHTQTNKHRESDLPFPVRTSQFIIPLKIKNNFCKQQLRMR